MIADATSTPFHCYSGMRGVLGHATISYMSKSRSRLFTASRAPTSLWPSSSEAGWLRRSDADGTRPGRRPPPGNRSPELRAPACAKSFLGRWSTRGGVSRSVGCRSGLDDATGRVRVRNEQRGHCSAHLSDAVAALLTALKAHSRGVAPHCWHEMCSRRHVQSSWRPPHVTRT